jgi:hypothetical protein
VRGVHEPVEHGIGDCGIDDHLVPMIDGELAGSDSFADECDSMSSRPACRPSAPMRSPVSTGCSAACRS